MNEHDETRPGKKGIEPEPQVRGEHFSSGKSGYPSLFPTWKDLLAIVGVFILSNLFAGYVALAFSGGEVTGPVTFVTYITAFAVTIGFALTLAGRHTKTFSRKLRISFKGFDPTVILWGLILMIAMNIVIEPLVNLLPPEWYDEVGQRAMNGGWAMATAVVIAPVCEEILFRGIIQNGLVHKHGAWGGILAASALFGVIHGIPQQMIAGFFLGIIIGVVYYKTGSLLSVIMLHAINNTLALFMSLFENRESGTAQTLRDTIGSDPAYRITYGICLLLLTVFLIQAVAATKKRKEKSKLQSAEKA